jgi:hypothetical protein
VLTSPVTVVRFWSLERRLFIFRPGDITVCLEFKLVKLCWVSRKLTSGEPER